MFTSHREAHCQNTAVTSHNGQRFGYYTAPSPNHQFAAPSGYVKTQKVQTDCGATEPPIQWVAGAVSLYKTAET